MEFSENEYIIQSTCCKHKKKHTHTTILFDIYIGTTFDCENPIKWQRKLLDKYLGIKIVVYAGN